MLLTCANCEKIIEVTPLSQNDCCAECNEAHYQEQIEAEAKAEAEAMESFVAQYGEEEAQVILYEIRSDERWAGR